MGAEPVVTNAEQTGTAQLARARGRAYVLLGELVARGLTSSTRGPARASALLSAALDSYAEGDALDADHHDVFLAGVFPLEDVYLHADGLVGTEAAEPLQRLLEQSGVREDSSELPGHLSSVLRGLALLSAEQGHASLAGLGRSREHLVTLLDAHLLRWFAPFAAAVRRMGRAFPSALIDQLEGLLVEHREGLGGAMAEFALAGNALDSDDEGVGVRDLARWFATPARFGAFVSHADIDAWAKAGAWPRGYGSRVDRIEALLHTAAENDEFARLMEVIAAWVSVVAEAMAAGPLAETGATREAVRPWKDRLGASGGIVENLRRRAGQGGGAVGVN